MRFPTTCTALALLTTTTLAQQTIDELFGASAGDGFGTAVAFVGDLDHDGKADFAVGAPGDDTAGAQAGSVTVFSGADRTVLFRWDGLLALGRLGSSVDGAGDVDRDGYDDVIAGAPGVSQALVFSGRTGAILYDIAVGAGVEFGTSVAGIGFADTDDWPDFAVGATGGVGLWVFSGRTGGLHWTSPVASLELADLGDVDGDGYDDLIAGDHTYNAYGGRAVLFSGLTGTTIRTHAGDNTFLDSLGRGVSGFGDVDGDGVGDYGYGVPCICFATHYALVRSGASGAILHYLERYTFGWDMAPGGDLDLDGTPDILVSEPGLLYAFSGTSGLELAQFTGGVVIDGGADADGDMLMDILAGAAGDDTNGMDAGRVSLYTLGCPYPAPVNYCTPEPNSTGVPARIDWQNSTSVQSNHFRLLASDCPPDQFALFFYGTTPTQVPVGNGNLCVGGSQFRLYPASPTGPGGAPTHNLDLTSPPSPAGRIEAGQTWYFQCWYRDPAGGGSGYNFSDGLEVTFCP